MGTTSSPCFVVFPFMSHGHTIPLLHLSRLLRLRGFTVAIFTTPANAPPIRSFFKDMASLSIVELPFPTKPIDGVPPGVENTHHLPSMAAFVDFAKATELMKPEFEKALTASVQPVGCIISDAFLGWTQDTAAKLGVPRYFFFGMSAFATTMYQVLGRERPHAQAVSPDEPFLVPNFPGLMLTRNHFDPPFNEIQPSGPLVDFMIHQGVTMAKSQGLIVNSFYELESTYIDYWNNNEEHKAWCVGPLSLASKPPNTLDSQNQPWMQWLDHKSPVLYVAFGTQAEISREQLKEIAFGLEKSEKNFLWVIRPNLLKHLEGFEERVKDRGLFVKDWVNQNDILMHKSVRGFLSHCGWNSVLDSICAKVPILALPFMAEQHMNARLVTEEVGVGLRVKPRGGLARGFVEAKEVGKMVRELMEGQTSAVVRSRVEEMGGAAVEAMRSGGSSFQALDMLIEDACGGKEAFPLSALIK